MVFLKTYRRMAIGYTFQEPSFTVLLLLFQICRCLFWGGQEKIHVWIFCTAFPPPHPLQAFNALHPFSLWHMCSKFNLPFKFFSEKSLPWPSHMQLIPPYLPTYGGTALWFTLSSTWLSALWELGSSYPVLFILSPAFGSVMAHVKKSVHITEWLRSLPIKATLTIPCPGKIK